MRKKTQQFYISNQPTNQPNKCNQSKHQNHVKPSNQTSKENQTIPPLTLSKPLLPPIRITKILSFIFFPLLFSEPPSMHQTISFFPFSFNFFQYSLATPPPFSATSRFPRERAAPSLFSITSHDTPPELRVLYHDNSTASPAPLRTLREDTAILRAKICK